MKGISNNSQYIESFCRFLFLRCHSNYGNGSIIEYIFNGFLSFVTRSNHNGKKVWPYDYLCLILGIKGTNGNCVKTIKSIEEVWWSRKFLVKEHCALFVKWKVILCCILCQLIRNVSIIKDVFIDNYVMSFFFKSIIFLEMLLSKLWRVDIFSTKQRIVGKPNVKIKLHVLFSLLKLKLL